MQVPGRHSISVVTPVYNGEASIAELCRRLSEVLPKIATEYEIILVNDGSRDRSWEIISELSSRFATVRGLNLMRNYGQHNALLCGIRAAKCEVIVTMDDDLQHAPEEIPRLLEQLQQGFDVVYGAPEAERHPPLRALAPREWDRTVRAVGEPPAVLPWLWAADLLVLPSRYETVGLVVAEAMCTGLPVVAILCVTVRGWSVRSRIGWGRARSADVRWAT